jgi:hypothetical protein
VIKIKKSELIEKLTMITEDFEVDVLFGLDSFPITNVVKDDKEKKIILEFDLLDP